ncbi:MAG: transposase [Planctomycetes bacterium]|nr:transposase [Planctomycetota bacterium]
MIFLVMGVLRVLLQGHKSLVVENAALRHQLVVLQRSAGRPRLKPKDRRLWAALSKHWAEWKDALVLVQPATVIGWQRTGFKLFWRWKGRPGRGRPQVSQELRQLIREMSKANRLWGAPRIQAELAKLGLDVARSTVAKYMVRHRKGKPAAGPSWATFLRTHLRPTAAIDFFTVATANFRVLYVFVVLSLARRQILHVNVTALPTAEWTAQQIVEAFPWGDVPTYLQRDRDATFGNVFRRQVRAMGIKELISAPRSPWQNGYVERVIGTIRRDCLDHVIVFGENHLRQILKEYIEYYDTSRTHLGLEGDCPDSREVESEGRVYAVPWLDGLHHTYRRNAG